MTTRDHANGLEQSIIVLKGIGKKLSERFAKRSLFSLNDLLFHLPIRYQDKTKVVNIAHLQVGHSALFTGELLECQVQTLRRTVLSCVINDGTGVINVRFFHFNSAQAKSLINATEQGRWLSCFADIKRGRNSLEVIHPEYHIINDDYTIPIDNSLTPVYPTTEGLSQGVLRNTIKQALNYLERAVIDDYLPFAIREELKLPSLNETLNYLHHPPPDSSAFELHSDQNHYRQRLVLEELLAHQLSMKCAYQKKKQLYSYSLSIRNHPDSYCAKFLKQLPFQLTQAQQRVIADIAEDLTVSHPMQRLVQGDVGSGKTMVAVLAALYAIENGFQVALMAPTELLAEQHYNNFQQWLEVLNLQVAWLSGQCKVKQRREALQCIADGSANMVIGTHALFQEKVVFHHLGLVIIDEQHRFGVHQRFALIQKGIKKETDKEYYPHQLSMTATPIPRTLAMTAYADLDCSVIDELPPGRTPVETVVIGEHRRNEVLERVHQACLTGRQAYWVCTLIEESELLQCQAAEETYKILQEAFPNLAIGLVHGRMKNDEKQAIMNAFKAGELLLLIATTVIEVGVDVPNASVMIIENAERLGLSQLHQLRGRVGRGSQSSACILMYSHPLSKNGKARLMILRGTNDGFIVAQKDLELRGAGELMGTRQTGLAEMKIADLMRDQHLIPKIDKLAQCLMQEYPDNIEPIINRWIGKKMEYYSL
ncbi:MAG: ATP-dependent DNA helicase RecG [Gammaproteobacteria bacterium]|nr:ATP-dependent DNA helicase RecG [Gammaproteobacteria bacterium]